MTTFYFVAGEQVITVQSRTLLDAWLLVANRSRRLPIADEFRRLPIEAYDVEGNKLATHSWAQWDAAVLRDTYGSNYREILDHAAELI